MRIGLIADTHDDQHRLQRALDRLKTEGITVVLHAGDVTSARMLRLLDGFEVWIARGNMDRDPGLIAAAHELFGPGHLRKTHTLSLDGVSVALVHDGDSEIARELIASEDYDYVVHGHSHRPRDERVGGTRVINPGALGSLRWYPPSFAILDLATGDLSLERV